MKFEQLTALAAGLLSLGMPMPNMSYIPKPHEKKNDPERIALAEAKRNRKAAKRLKLIKDNYEQ